MYSPSSRGACSVAHNDGTIYRTRDLESAFRLQTALTTLGKDDDETAGPPGIVDTHCIKLDEPEPIRDSKFMCAMVYGRYVAVIGARAGFGDTGAEDG
ncbi:DUF7373 family lipoprotein [Nocardia australiensis]|uniref:DUF7373 family lipoprotein n=1 Tax=Nocardia australiensis TaxID=2887191 RepID=UPI003FD8567E